MQGRIQPRESRVDELADNVPGLEIKPAAEVREWVLANAGARPADRDLVDTRVIKSQDEVDGWPELKENRRGLTASEPSGTDGDGDGYTSLKE